MIWYQWLAVMWMTMVGITCSAHIIEQMNTSLSGKDTEPVLPHLVIIGGSIVLTMMAFKGFTW